MTTSISLYFVRHGQTMLNKYDRIQGWIDSPLTDNGIEDAVLCGKGLKDVKFQAVYSSDMKRAVDTAKYILAENNFSSGLKINKVPEFREQNFGSFEGQDAYQNWEKIYRLSEFLSKTKEYKKTSPIKIQMDLFHLIDPYGDAENFHDFWDRIQNGLQKVINDHRDGDYNILISSHGLTIRNIIHELCPDYEINSMLNNGSLTLLNYEDGLFHVKKYNKKFY